MTATQLAELKRLGARISDTAFVCAGSVDPTPRGDRATGVSICYQDAQGQPRLLSLPTNSLGELEQLAAACAPATFGRDDQDVLDPTYRQALKMDPSRFLTSFHVAEYPILTEVQRLVGLQAVGVRAVTHKLNVYTNGGFFKPHQDTPRNANTIGTLVVCLPTQFEGGEFVVKSADGSFTHAFDWGAADAAANGKVQWCAFYSDCEHEVLPVRAGHRVTLTYVLEHQPVETPPLIGAQPFTAFGDRLGELLKDPSFAPQGTKLGFGLKHQYVISRHGSSFYSGAARSTSECAIVTAGHTTPPLMKGADRVLKETLDGLGLQYAFVPVYVASQYRTTRYGGTAARADASDDDDDPENYGDDVLTPSEWRFPFSTDGNPQGEWRGDGNTRLFISDWGTYVRRTPADFYDGGRSDLDFGMLALHKAREVVWVVPPSNFPYLKTGIVYGNEAELGHYYAAACLVVYIPPSNRRVGATTTTAP